VKESTQQYSTHDKLAAPDAHTRTIQKNGDCKMCCTSTCDTKRDTSNSAKSSDCCHCCHTRCPASQAGFSCVLESRCIVCNRQNQATQQLCSTYLVEHCACPVWGKPYQREQRGLDPTLAFRYPQSTAECTNNHKTEDKASRAQPLPLAWPVAMWEINKTCNSATDN